MHLYAAGIRVARLASVNAGVAGHSFLNHQTTRCFRALFRDETDTTTRRIEIDDLARDDALISQGREITRTKIAACVRSRLYRSLQNVVFAHQTFTALKLIIPKLIILFSSLLFPSLPPLSLSYFSKDATTIDTEDTGNKGQLFL